MTSDLCVANKLLLTVDNEVSFTREYIPVIQNNKQNTYHLCVQMNQTSLMQNVCKSKQTSVSHVFTKKAFIAQNSH